MPLAGRLNAAVPLFDFEQPADVEAWNLHSKSQGKLERTNRFATTGNWSLVALAGRGQGGFACAEIADEINDRLLSRSSQTLRLA